MFIFISYLQLHIFKVIEEVYERVHQLENQSQNYTTDYTFNQTMNIIIFELKFLFTNQEFNQRSNLNNYEMIMKLGFQFWNSIMLAMQTGTAYIPHFWSITWTVQELEFSIHIWERFKFTTTTIAQNRTWTVPELEFNIHIWERFKFTTNILA